MNYIAYDSVIAQKIAELQYFQKREVLDFVNFLLSKLTKKRQKNKSNSNGKGL